MRSATEINANKDIELTGNEANLVAYYKFNDGSGQIATNQSSTTNNAVLGSSNTAYTDDPTWVKVNHAITSVSSYRYGFNGMEKDDELKGNGNSYTTHFRQYDPRLGRWLTLDPKMAKLSFHSPYVAYANNPVYYVDPRGDIFRVGKGKQAKTDVKDLQSRKSKKAHGGKGYVRFAADGTVSLDFAGMQEKKIAKALKKDSGLRLINDMINAKDKDKTQYYEKDGIPIKVEFDEYYFYGTQGNMGVVPHNPSDLKGSTDYWSGDINTKGSKPYPKGKIPSYYDNARTYDHRLFMMNASINPRNANDGSSDGFKPSDGYSGKVFIANGNFFTVYKDTEGNFQWTMATRSKVVFHELKENFLRTNSETKYNYDQSHGDAGGTKAVFFFQF